MSDENTFFKKIQKCSNYAVLTMIVANTITSLKKFKSIPRSTIITETYNSIKQRASKG